MGIYFLQAENTPKPFSAPVKVKKVKVEHLL